MEPHIATVMLNSKWWFNVCLSSACVEETAKLRSSEKMFFTFSGLLDRWTRGTYIGFPKWLPTGGSHGDWRDHNNQIPQEGWHWWFKGCGHWGELKMFCHLSIIYFVDSVSSTSGRVGSDVHTVTHTHTHTEGQYTLTEIFKYRWITNTPLPLPKGIRAFCILCTQNAFQYFFW